jgi:hypothetical protein
VPYTTRVRPSARCIFLFLLSCGVLHADETLQQAQRELRVRRYYFGPVDGAASKETTAAIGGFQKAKALDATGALDEETLRALGLRNAPAQSAEARAQQLGREWLARYWRACESGDWREEERFYMETLRYYTEGIVSRETLRGERLRDYANWPRRRHVAVLGYASWAEPERELWVSARVRHEAVNRAGERRVLTEELLFKLKERGGNWRIYEVGEVPLSAPKSLP